MLVKNKKDVGCMYKLELNRVGAKLEIIQNVTRRHNLRIHGIPETVEGNNLVELNFRMGGMKRLNTSGALELTDGLLIQWKPPH